jgi:hypothetical protein
MIHDDLIKLKRKKESELENGMRWLVKKGKIMVLVREYTEIKCAMKIKIEKSTYHPIITSGCK